MSGTSEIKGPTRSCGILLHMTSLPSRHGVGDLGPAAYDWAESLASARQSWWQVLPLGPTGYGDSPYQCFSAFAGNPLLISPDLLVLDGLLRGTDLASVDFPANLVDYERVIPYKAGLMKRAWENFRDSPPPHLPTAFEGFCLCQAGWLDDFALFMALKHAHGGGSWQGWPSALLLREPHALDDAKKALSEQTGLHKFEQFLFFRQWDALKEFAHARGVRFIGDMPIFVATDSADVWTHPELFQLDPLRRPTVVAGVPPDYFSTTGQLWGNPLYDWPAHRQTGYAWWLARMRAALDMVDVVRMDHFRGFEASWEVPAGSATAETGRWAKGPGADLFEKARLALGGLPLIAEDLGVITPDVEALRQRFGLPGMRILQFAFGGAREDRFLPHHYERNTVVYTGAHDNETTLGWHRSLTASESRFFSRYAPSAQQDPAWGLLRIAWASVADVAVAPLQDVLRLGPEARMNVPGRPSGNWRWRLSPNLLTEAVLDELGDLTEVYDRAPTGEDIYR